MVEAKMLRTVAAVSLLALAGAASAEAFNGPYVGGEIGWQQDRVKVDQQVGGSALVSKTKKSSLMGGGFLGYNAQLDGFVLGGEFNLDWGGKTGAFVGTDGEGVTSVGDIRAKRTINVVAKAGALVTPSTLLYGKVGYGNARYRVNWDGLSEGKSRSGYVLGAGVEQAFTPNISARVEYKYSHFGKGRELFEAVGLSTDKNSLKRNEVTVGVAYHF